MNSLLATRCSLLVTRYSLLAVPFFALYISASAQSVFIGPSASYIVSTAVPDEVSQNGAPTRLALGVVAVLPARKKLEFRFDLNYRIENGAFSTNYESETRTESGIRVIPSEGRNPRISVVDPTPMPQIYSTLNTSSVEFAASMVFPVADLDTSGSTLSIQLGALVDRVLSAKQVDDYTAIPDYTGPSTINVDYEGQFGFGAILGVGITLPVGADHIMFDVRYVFRQPNTITSTTTPPVDQNITWLVGRGLRIGVGYLFAL